MSQPFALSIEGMHCGACVRRVRAALDKIPGVTVGEVAIGKAAGTLETASLEAVAAAVTQAGYPATPAPTTHRAPDAS